MKVNIDITHITVVNDSNDLDHVFFYTTMLEQMWLFTGVVVLKMNCINTRTKDFLNTYFPDVPVTFRSI